MANKKDLNEDFVRGIRLHLFSDIYARKNIRRYYEFFYKIENYTNEELTEQLIQYNIKNISNFRIKEIYKIVSDNVEKRKLIELIDLIESYKETQITNINIERYNKFIKELLSEYLESIN
ncbi:MAG: hypothetical protein GYA61_03580 [Spirochaetales bacterium]|nr:hypothetical protein [Spirochaetales bacterium]